MRKQLFVALACLFVVMIGFGITLPVLPFYVERLALARGASRQSMVMHVTLLTAVYALMQLFFAPLWGRWSDRIGRRPVLLIGLAGFAIAQVLFGLATSLWLLYTARIIGGILSAATRPVSAALVSRRLRIASCTGPVAGDHRFSERAGEWRRKAGGAGRDLGDDAWPPRVVRQPRQGQKNQEALLALTPLRGGLTTLTHTANSRG